MLYILIISIFLTSIKEINCCITQKLIDDEFFNFQKNFNKLYGDKTEESKRKQIFSNTFSIITVHNNNPSKLFTMAINPFADLDSIERNRWLGDLTKSFSGKRNTQERRDVDNNLPSSWDWRNYCGVVRPIKNQGSCGSCWAHASSAAVESLYAIAKLRQVDLSPQNLVDCSTSDYGCDGGYAAFNYIKTNGIYKESDYTYYAAKDKCQNLNKEKFNVTDYFSSSGETSMKSSILINPFYASIKVIDSFFNYKSGIYNGCGSSDIDTNHAVLVIGYGSDNGNDYWIIKNSWGREWGENGYGKILRNKKMCGIGSFYSYPILNAFVPSSNYLSQNFPSVPSNKKCYSQCADGFSPSSDKCSRICPPGFRDDGLLCGKPNSYGRGVGYGVEVTDDCSAGMISRCEKDNGVGNCEKSGLIVYPKCKSGFSGVGPVCWQSCPSGFRNDGAFCAKPGSYGRGAGYPWKFGDGLNDNGMFKRCEGDHGKGNCEKSGAIVYPKCKAGFYAVGCCVCSPICPSGMIDIGVSCAKSSYGRGVGYGIQVGDCNSVLIAKCEAKEGRGNCEINGAIAYPKCKVGFYAVGCCVCSPKCPSDMVDIGVSCAKNSYSRDPCIFGLNRDCY